MSVLIKRITKMLLKESIPWNPYKHPRTPGGGGGLPREGGGEFLAKPHYQHAHGGGGGRTDVHRPSVINPADYEFIGQEYAKIEPGDLGTAQFLMEERRRIQEHMKKTGGTYSGHKHGGNCHVCGASAMYTMLFHHKPSNTYVRTGSECADKLGCSEDGAEFRKNIQNALAAQAGKRKAQTILANAGLEDAWNIYANSQGEAKSWAEGTLRDIVGKLVQYGNLSDKQLSFLRKLAGDIKKAPEIAAARQAETDAAAPVPVSTERMSVDGVVLTVREPDRNDEFPQAKMLVKHDSGWKVWGSVPRAISSVKRGDRVSFDAMIKVSNKDPKFGFFGRPTKPKITQESPKSESTEIEFLCRLYEDYDVSD